MAYFRYLVYVYVTTIMVNFSSGEFKIIYLDLNTTFLLPEGKCAVWTKVSSTVPIDGNRASIIAYKEAAGTYYCTNYGIHVIIIEKNVTLDSTTSALVGENITISCSMSAYISTAMNTPKKFALYKSLVELKSISSKDGSRIIDNKITYLSPTLSTAYVAKEGGDQNFNCRWEFEVEWQENVLNFFKDESVPINFCAQLPQNCSDKKEIVTTPNTTIIILEQNFNSQPHKFNWSCTFENRSWIGDNDTFQLADYGIYNCSYIAFNKCGYCTWNGNIIVNTVVKDSVEKGTPIGMIIGIIIGCLVVIIIILVVLFLNKRYKKKKQTVGNGNTAVISKQEKVSNGHDGKILNKQGQNEEHIEIVENALYGKF